MNYFDHAASSVIYPEVVEAICESLKVDFANPSSKHVLGYNQHEQLSAMKNDFLKALEAQPLDHFIFTSSATESNNTLIKGLRLKANSTVIYSPADHPSVVNPVQFMAKKYGLVAKEMKHHLDGPIDRDHLLTLLNEDVSLIIFTHVNSQSGVIEDIEALASLVKKHSKAHVHIDAVQSFGKIKCIFSKNIDSLSIASHKIGGPKGIAGLYVKKNVVLEPILHGGGQEEGLRSGTVAYPLAKGFHLAMKKTIKDRDSSFNKIKELNLEIIEAIKSIIPNAQFTFSQTSPYIISFVLPKYSSDIILRHLEMKDVFISSTSACSSKIKAYNPSLMALNIPEKFHKHFLRISMSPLTTKEEVLQLTLEMKNVWKTLESIR